MLDFSYNWHGANILTALQENITPSSISHKFGLSSKILKNRLVRLFSMDEKCIITALELPSICNFVKLLLR